MKRFARMRYKVIDEGGVTQLGRDSLLEPAVMSAAYFHHGMQGMMGVGRRYGNETKGMTNSNHSHSFCIRATQSEVGNSSPQF